MKAAALLTRSTGALVNPKMIASSPSLTKEASRAQKLAERPLQKPSQKPSQKPLQKLAERPPCKRGAKEKHEDEDEDAPQLSARLSDQGQARQHGQSLPLAAW